MSRKTKCSLDEKLKGIIGISISRKISRRDMR